MSSVKKILERALRPDDGKGPLTAVMLEASIREALAALEAEEAGRPTWWQLRKMIMDTADASVGKDYEHRSAEAEALANWIEQRYGVQPAIPLPGQSPERERPEQTEAFRAVVLDDLLSGGERTISPGGGMEQRPDWRPYLQESSAGLREAVRAYRDELAAINEHGPYFPLLATDVQKRLDAALRAEEQSHE